MKAWLPGLGMTRGGPRLGVALALRGADSMANDDDLGRDLQTGNGGRRRLGPVGAGHRMASA